VDSVELLLVLVSVSVYLLVFVVWLDSSVWECVYVISVFVSVWVRVWLWVFVFV